MNPTMRRTPRLGLWLAVPLLLITVAVPPAGCAGGSTKRQKMADEFMTDAERYLDEGLTDSALEAFSRALDENPDLTQAYRGIGHIYLERDQLDNAAAAFEKAVAIEPNSFSAQYDYGLVQHLMGDLRSAVAVYLKALSIDPSDVKANRNLAAAYIQLGLPTDALGYAQQATRLPDAEQADWANLAAAHSLLNEHDQAVDAYRQAAELGEIREPILLGLANSHIQLGNYARALITLETLERRVEGALSSTSYERMGVAQFRLRRYEDALSSFQSALDQNPRDVSALNGVGATYMTLYLEGEREDRYQRSRAIASWKRSVQINPSQPLIVDLIARYGKL
ncbi:MAG: tetratricopeptide repeat protein [Planctomycetota bacterium]